MMKLRFVPEKSSLTVETRAKGVLAKLAHDLSIEAKSFACSATHDGGRAHIEIVVSVADLRVVGALKAGSVDISVLSSSDKNDIDRKLRSEVLRGEKVVAKLDCETALEAGNRALTARGTVEVGAGSVRVSSHLDLQVRDALIVARARMRVNLPGLGITPPRGPLGAFRVDDDVEVVIRLEFERAS